MYSGLRDYQDAARKIVLILWRCPLTRDTLFPKINVHYFWEKVYSVGVWVLIFFADFFLRSTQSLH